MNFGDIFNIKIQDGNHSDKEYIGDDPAKFMNMAFSYKEEEKNYKKPKVSKIWNFLIYGSTIAIGIFLIWLYSAYIFINK